MAYVKSETPHFVLYASVLFCFDVVVVVDVAIKQSVVEHQSPSKPLFFQL
jgi:hypothetical protein